MSNSVIQHKLVFSSAWRIKHKNIISLSLCSVDDYVELAVGTSGQGVYLYRFDSKTKLFWLIHANDPPPLSNAVTPAALAFSVNANRRELFKLGMDGGRL